LWKESLEKLRKIDLLLEKLENLEEVKPIKEIKVQEVYLYLGKYKVKTIEQMGEMVITEALEPIPIEPTEYSSSERLDKGERLTVHFNQLKKEQKQNEENKVFGSS
jgi:hypothetical protein